jgi:SAM-dependent methyltransferase
MPVRRFFCALFALIGVAASVGGVAIYLWLSERYGRGGPFPARAASALLNPARALLDPVRPSLEFFRLASGQTVLEIGPGPGYFTIEAARMAGPAGRLVSLDVQPAMASILRGRLREHGIPNAHPLAGDAMRLPLADRSIDAAFLVAVLGEVPDRPAALVEVQHQRLGYAIVFAASGLGA